MITSDKVKNQIQTLINTANEKTGNNDADLTSAVGSLVNGYGGGDSVNPFEFATGFEYLFSNATFPSGTEYVLNVPNFKEGSNRCFRYVKGIKKVVFKGNVNDIATSLQYAFQQRASTELEEIDFSEWGSGGVKVNYLNNAFSQATKLHTIKGFFDFTNAVNLNSAFQYTYALVNITVKPNTLSKSISFVNSPLLSDASIQSIINGLADLTGQTAQVLTVHKDVRAKIESNPQQLASITGKNWTLM